MGGFVRAVEDFERRRLEAETKEKREAEERAAVLAAQRAEFTAQGTLIMDLLELEADEIRGAGHEVQVRMQVFDGHVAVNMALKLRIVDCPPISITLRVDGKKVSIVASYKIDAQVGEKQFYNDRLSNIDDPGLEQSFEAAMEALFFNIFQTHPPRR